MRLLADSDIAAIAAVVKSSEYYRAIDLDFQVALENEDWGNADNAAESLSQHLEAGVYEHITSNATSEAELDELWSEANLYFTRLSQLV